MVISEVPRKDDLIQLISGASSDEVDILELEGIEEEIKNNLKQQLQENKYKFLC